VTRGDEIGLQILFVVLREIHYVNLTRLRRKQGLQTMKAKASEALSALDDDACHACVFELRQQLRPAIVRARSDLLDHPQHTCSERRAACHSKFSRCSGEETCAEIAPFSGCADTDSPSVTMIVLVGAC
jgi:hypothetical protein